jgi:hypothetical protein
MITHNQTQNRAPGLYALTLLVFLLALAVGIWTQPAHTANELDRTGSVTTSTGYVARYQIPAASTTAEVTPAIYCAGYRYATVQLTNGDGTGLTGSAAPCTLTVKGSALPNAGYETAIPQTIGGATDTATIQHYGTRTYELGALNQFRVSVSGNSATQELIISLSDKRPE